MSSFSKRLIALRKERDLTQAECAKANNIQRSTYSGYETEGKEPNYKTLCTLAEFFGVTTDYLLGVSNARTHNDAVFVNDTSNFAQIYEQLSASPKQAVVASFDAFYAILSRDMKIQQQERLDLYAELFALVEKKRTLIRTSIENNKGSDPLFLSTLMTEQTNFKNEVSAILDRLMQADLGFVTQKGSRMSSEKSAM